MVRMELHQVLALELGDEVRDGPAPQDLPGEEPPGPAFSRPSQGFSYSVRFDENVIQATGTDKIFGTTSSTPYAFERAPRKVIPWLPALR